MPKIIKDERDWNVRVILNRENCTYLFFPCNYYGCGFYKPYWKPCTLDNCPIVTTAKVPEGIKNIDRNI